MDAADDDGGDENCKNDGRLRDNAESVKAFFFLSVADCDLS